MTIKVRYGGGTVRADSYFRQLHAVVEVDGRRKYASPDDLWRRRAGRTRSGSEGYEVVRLGWADLRGDPEQIRLRILAARDRGLRRAG